MTVPSATLPSPTRYKLFTPIGVFIATLLGSPLAGSLLFFLNYRRQGLRRSAWLSLLFGVFGTVGLLLVGVLLPSSIPSLPLAVGASFGTFHLAKLKLANGISTHTAAGGRTASNFLAAGIGVATLALLLLLLLGHDQLTTPPSVEVSPGHTIHYSDGATADTARRLGGAMERAGYFTPNHPATVLVAGKTGLTVSLVVADGVWTEPESMAALRVLQSDLSKAMNADRLILRLVDSSLSEHARVP